MKGENGPLEGHQQWLLKIMLATIWGLNVALKGHHFDPPFLCSFGASMDSISAMNTHIYDHPFYAITMIVSQLKKRNQIHDLVDSPLVELF